MTDDEARQKARELEDAARKAADAAKDIMLSTIDLSETLDNTRKVGAMVTAASLIYAEMLATINKLKGENAKGLTIALYMNLVVPELEEMDD